jgi:hypothetical protein
MQNFIKSLVVVLFLLLLSQTAFAQEWSDTQKEIWNNVQTYWAFDDNMDLTGFSQYFDDSYEGWSYDTEKPMNRMEVINAIQDDYLKNKDNTIKTDLTPLKIWVNGNMAFIHYTYSRNVTSGDGTTKTITGRWTDILMKKGDKWLLVGDHGGNVDNK